MNCETPPRAEILRNPRAESGSVVSFPARPRRHTAMPRQWHLSVRIAAGDGRAPYGRSRIYHLTNHDLERLLAHVESLDRRSS